MGTGRDSGPSVITGAVKEVRSMKSTKPPMKLDWRILKALGSTAGPSSDDNK